MRKVSQAAMDTQLNTARSVMAAARSYSYRPVILTLIHRRHVLYYNVGRRTYYVCQKKYKHLSIKQNNYTLN